MHREPVKSSRIKSIGHDPLTNKMEIEFQRGGTFSFDGVSAEQHQGLMNSGSIGKHFNEHFKSNSAHSCSKCG